MGQYQQPYLDPKGACWSWPTATPRRVPFALSNRGYGLLWNNPAIGKVTFGKNLTEWVAYSTKRMDYRLP